MFLRRVHIQNIRSLKDVAISFALAPSAEILSSASRRSASKPKVSLSSRKWTLILGENGLGKSTILRSIALITAGSDALPELLGEADPWVSLTAREGVIEAEVSTAEGETRQLKLVIRRGLGISNILKENSDNLKSIDDALKHTKRNYFVVGYGVSRRLPRRELTSVAPKRSSAAVRAGPVATLFDPDATLNPLETWAMDLHYRKGRAALGLIRDTINSTLPHVKFARVDKKKRQLLFATPDGIVPLKSLSDGYQNVAGWLGDLLFCVTETFSSYAKPLDTRGLLLIDELDLHLHPTWQRQIRDFLNARLPNFQIVATTHSALTAHQTGQGELHYLQRVNKVPSINVFDGDASSLSLTQLIASPIFGLNTLDSVAVEGKKKEYIALKGARRQKSKSKSDSRLQALASELRGIPNAVTLTTGEKKLEKTLSSIHQALSVHKAVATPPKKKPRSLAVRALRKITRKRAAPR